MFSNGHCVARKSNLLIHIPPRVCRVSPVRLPTGLYGEQTHGRPTMLFSYQMSISREIVKLLLHVSLSKILHLVHQHFHFVREIDQNKKKMPTVWYSIERSDDSSRQTAGLRRLLTSSFSCSLTSCLHHNCSSVGE